MGRWSWYRSLDRPYNSFGTPNFVLAKPRKCHPTVSVTCADDGCLRIGFLTDFSGSLRFITCTYLHALLLHVAAIIFLSHACHVHGNQ
jgi:hypothetical protein